MSALQLSEVVLEPSAEDQLDLPTSTSAEVLTSTEVSTSELSVSTIVSSNVAEEAVAVQNIPPVAPPAPQVPGDVAPEDAESVVDDLAALEREVGVLDWDEVSSEASDVIHNVVDNIIERMRVERMFELRRMRLGDQTVTTGSQREQLEQFFSRDTDESSEPRRPQNENIREDLDGLHRQRSVSNLLNTRFRRVLEHSLANLPAPNNQIGHRSQPQHGPPPPAPPLPPADIGINPPVRDTEDYSPPSFDHQFDHVIDDVEELFQRRLVSDVLHSAFRNVLELHIERRLIRSGRPPAQRFVPVPQAQPQRQHHNMPTGTSVILPTSRRLPELERQMTSMAGELKELKSMLKLMLDSQLDMQRALRQEVSALIRNSTETPARPTKPIKEGCCVICLEKPADTVLYRCGHLCCCTTCGRMLKAEGHHCPVCRAEVKDILRIFHSAQDN